MPSRGPTCAVDGCKNNRLTGVINNRPISFHRFPSDKHLRETWMSKIYGSINNVIFNANARICSEHFQEDDYVRDLRAELMGTKSRKILKEGAIPSKALPTNQSPPFFKDVLDTSVDSSRNKPQGNGTEHLSNDQESAFATNAKFSAENLLNCLSSSAIIDIGAAVTICNNDTDSHPFCQVVNGEELPNNKNSSDNTAKPITKLRATNVICKNVSDSKAKRSIGSTFFDLSASSNIRRAVKACGKGLITAGSNRRCACDLKEVFERQEMIIREFEKREKRRQILDRKYNSTKRQLQKRKDKIKCLTKDLNEARESLKSLKKEVRQLRIEKIKSDRLLEEKAKTLLRKIFSSTEVKVLLRTKKLTGVS